MKPSILILIMVATLFFAACGKEPLPPYALEIQEQQVETLNTQSSGLGRSYLYEGPNINPPNQEPE